MRPWLSVWALLNPPCHTPPLPPSTTSDSSKPVWASLSVKRMVALFTWLSVPLLSSRVMLTTGAVVSTTQLLAPEATAACVIKAALPAVSLMVTPAGTPKVLAGAVMPPRLSVSPDATV